MSSTDTGSIGDVPGIHMPEEEFPYMFAAYGREQTNPDMVPLFADDPYEDEAETPKGCESENEAKAPEVESENEAKTPEVHMDESEAESPEADVDEPEAKIPEVYADEPEETHAFEEAPEESAGDPYETGREEREMTESDRKSKSVLDADGKAGHEIGEEGEAKSDMYVQVDSEVKPEPDTDGKTEAEPDIEEKVEPESDTNGKIEFKSDTNEKAAPEPDTAGKTEPEPNPEKKAEPESDTDVDDEPESDTDIDDESESDTDVDDEPESDTDRDDEPESDPNGENESGRDMRTQASLAAPELKPDPDTRDADVLQSNNADGEQKTKQSEAGKQQTKQPEAGKQETKQPKDTGKLQDTEEEPFTEKMRHTEKKQHKKEKYPSEEKQYEKKERTPSGEEESVRPDQKKRRRRQTEDTYEEMIAGHERHESFLGLLAAGVRRAGSAIWHSRTYRGVRIAVILLILLGALAAIGHISVTWKYHSYQMDTDLVKVDTNAASYTNIENKILKYNLSEAELSEKSGKLLWRDGYTMTAPKMSSCGGTFVIYDVSGTQMEIYDQSGNLGSIETELPIVKAKISKKGDVAAILGSDENTWIQYYDKSGSKIATIKTTMDTPGYPMDVAVSEDGVILGGAFMNIGGDGIKSVLNFYNFSKNGHNLVDNKVDSEESKDTVVPQLDYMDNDTCIAYDDKGASIYKGSQTPKKLARINIKREILSVAHNADRVAFMVEKDDPTVPYTLLVYDLKGKKQFETNVAFDYQNMRMDSEQILLYNTTGICTYNMQGIRKFKGTIKDTNIKNVIPFGTNYYMIISDEGTFNIRLK